ncbi:TIGR04540 family protein [Mesobacillus subterraneus]|uniref:TIGR04540 family protein n=1 Tax=Mesobacillus subterraneus TaxID=285983 RepID=UPI0039B10840
MEVKLFQKTQRDMASVINQLIDSYWEDEISEQILFDKVNALHTNNPDKLVKGKRFTTVIQQQCGKRRLEIVKRIIKEDIED